MSHTRNTETVDWLRLAKEVCDKLLEAYQQLMKTEGLGIHASEPNVISSLAGRREVLIRQLQTVMESFSVPDLVDIPAKSQVTNLQLAKAILRELKELGLIKQHISSNIASLEDLIVNRKKRDEDLLEIIEGLKKETEAIEDENDEEEFRQLKKMTKSIREVLDTIFDDAYPEMKNDVKNVIQVLYQAKDEEDPYIQVPEDVDIQAITLLLTAKIIMQHETDPTRIKLMIY